MRPNCGRRVVPSMSQAVDASPGRVQCERVEQICFSRPHKYIQQGIRIPRGDLATPSDHSGMAQTFYTRNGTATHSSRVVPFRFSLVGRWMRLKVL